VSGPTPGDDADEAPPAGRRLVTGALALLLIAGIVGFEAWPLTAWRLFSLSRGDRQTVWVLQAVTPDEQPRVVELEDLPLRYRHAAWPMAELPGSSEARREDVCQALLGPAAELVPGLMELRVVRDRQRLVEAEGEWVVTHDPEILHACRPEAP